MQEKKIFTISKLVIDRCCCNGSHQKQKNKNTFNFDDDDDLIGFNRCTEKKTERERER